MEGVKIMEEQLKPCPFCGGEAHSNGTTKYTKKHEAWFEDGTRILFAYFCGCLICGATTRGIVGGHQTKEIAIRKWNTRTGEKT